MSDEKKLANMIAKVIKVLLIPVIVTVSAISFVTQWRSPDNQLDAERRRKLAGWLGPDMEPHWQRLFEWRWGDIRHDMRNVMSEWVRLDPQRAGKAFSFLLVVAVAACLFFAVT
jgi:hypothetical protein